MPLLKAINIRNFKCFRRAIRIPFEKSTYVVGINNSGKTALLKALDCFFNSESYRAEFLNKTEYAARKEGANRSEIIIEIDTNEIPAAKLKQRLLENYGNTLKIKKRFIFKEISKEINVDYSVDGGANQSFDELPQDIRTILLAFSISYIHPQEGAALLQKAQNKFKKRLFSNWGRHRSFSEKLKEIQNKWDEFRAHANLYLSGALTSKLKQIWPHSNTKVDLPEKIEDIVAVSDIVFRSSPVLPEITLTSQGTGAQSLILYQTHYILDSDRSLHRGLYFPLWLLEEPESFLHADIALKLGALLNSNEWMDSIQMVISTHSPIILASSKQNDTRTRWIVFENHTMKWDKVVSEISESDIEDIGVLMGDSNIDAYFIASQEKKLIFIEDEKSVTMNKFIESGIPIAMALKGISTLKKYVDVFSTVKAVVRKKAFFIVDNDKGAKEIKAYLQRSDMEENGFKRYPVSENVYIILAPESFSSEDFFSEYSEHVDYCFEKIFDMDFNFKSTIPTNLSRAVSRLRRETLSSIEDVKSVLKKEQDVKDSFWKKVAQHEYNMSDEYISALKLLTEL